MLISPPFLLPDSGKTMDAAEAGNPIISDGDVCAVGMQECAPGNGAYPVSYSLGWHGGAHLIAPRDAQGRDLPTRAIADGTVVYARQNSGESEALLYRGVRTDDGCVVIKHETEIGDGDNAKVIFFSIYMHLQTVLPSITAGKKIYRKDTLGVAGEIYGQMGQMHFEIVCDSANLQKLVGRESGTLVAENGRTDAIYGDIWFTVPTGASIFANEPHPYRLDDEESAPGPSIRPQQATFTTCDLVIRMRYELGNCTLTTFRQQDDGRYVEVGSPPSRDREYEYNLYKEATRLNARYAELGANFTVAPAPSAIYEMLRFGRIVGPDPLPVNGQFGHWREIKTPEGTGWTNLSSAAVGAFSDADFPHWAGWSLIDDDESTDSLCDSPTINRWLDLDGDGQVTHAEAVTALNSPIVRELMSKAICKFPIEWTKTDIDERWDWLMSPHEALPVPMWEVDFNTLKNHIEALAFWEEAMANEATLPGPSDCWHLPPTAFVEHFRKCGWLTDRELAQCIPRMVIDETRNSAGQRVYPRSSITWKSAKTRAERFAKPLNHALRRYGISNTRLRIAYFLANAIQETIYLTRTSELGGASTRYAPWYGRGLLQLTWEDNYRRYGKFRGFSPDASTFRDSLEHDLSIACDSAGFYWTSCAKEPSKALDISREADSQPVFTDKALPNVCDSFDYRTKTCRGQASTLQLKSSYELERVARAVNTGSPGSTGIVNGLVQRENVFFATVQTLTDTVFSGNTFVAQHD
jgi:hypothetical protein